MVAFPCPTDEPLVRRILLDSWFSPRMPGTTGAINIQSIYRSERREAIESALDCIERAGLATRTEHPDLGPQYAETQQCWRVREELLHEQRLRIRPLLEQTALRAEDLVLALAVSPSILDDRIPAGYLRGVPAIAVAEVKAVLFMIPDGVVDEAIAALRSRGLISDTTCEWHYSPVAAITATSEGEAEYWQTTQSRLRLTDDECALDERLDQASVLDAVCIIESERDQEQGTAFAIGARRFATCLHSFRPDSRVFAWSAVSAVFPSRVVATDEAHDIAVFEADLDVPFLALAEPGLLREGAATTTAIGFPGYQLGDSPQSVSLTKTGTRNLSGATISMVTGGIVAGMSGGPVINSRRQVVGVAFRGGTTPDDALREEYQAYLPATLIAALR